MRGGCPRDLFQQTRGRTKTRTGEIIYFNRPNRVSQKGEYVKIFHLSLLCWFDIFTNIISRCIFQFPFLNSYESHLRYQWVCLLQEWNARLKSFLCPRFNVMRSPNKCKLCWNDSANNRFVTMIWYANVIITVRFSIITVTNDQQVCEISLHWEGECLQ